MNASTAGAVPIRVLGAPSPGGLRLPDAKASAVALYAPRGVCWLPGGGLAVTDTGNHRVLIWRDLPTDDHAHADLVVGQPDATSEGPNAAGRGAARGLHLPTGILVTDDGRLVVADAWNHRVLVWNRVPDAPDTPPDAVLGQPDPTSTAANRGVAVGPRGFHGAYGIGIVAGDLWVADAHNRRVLVFDGVPRRDVDARAVLGQDDFARSEENRGGAPGPATFRWPHAIACTAGAVWIADAGNHRVLGWSDRAPVDGPADRVLGQRDFDTAFEMPHTPQGASRLRFPYALASAGPTADTLWVADTANNRVLGFRPESSADAQFVLGQPDFDAGGENRWSAVGPDTLCWPYGLALDGDRLAIADSGNNRVVVWRVPT